MLTRSAALGPLLLLGLAMAFTPASATPPLPHADGTMHEGVATCAGSNCHGASQPRSDSNVLQNEYFLWTREDRHAQAYKTLLNADSKRMGALLGLTPHESPRCLSCHTDFVPADKRGRRFRLSDGVGCEACHGGAGGWLESHVQPGATHAQNLAAGLYPAADPQARGRLCLSCHLGSKDHPIDHEIMGAGHPPLGFELDTFTAIQPAHYQLDADYATRKGIPSSAQVWATGQMTAALRFLEELASPRAVDGLFPELVFFDCYACHHDLSAPRWNAGTAPGLGVGKVRLNSVSLLLVADILATVDSTRSQSFDEAVRSLHRASQQSMPKLQAQARELVTLLDSALSAHGQRPWPAKDSWNLLDRVSRRALNTPDFSLAEQSNMALEALFLTLDQAGALKSTQKRQIRAALDKGYTLTNADKDYSVGGYTQAMRELRTALP